MCFVSISGFHCIDFRWIYSHKFSYFLYALTTKHKISHKKNLVLLWSGYLVARTLIKSIPSKKLFLFLSLDACIRFGKKYTSLSHTSHLSTLCKCNKCTQTLKYRSKLMVFTLRNVTFNFDHLWTFILGYVSFLTDEMQKVVRGAF